MQTEERSGTLVTFTPDTAYFGNFHFIPNIEKLLWNYVFLNNGLTIYSTASVLFQKRVATTCWNATSTATHFTPSSTSGR
jgi:DNA gyrase/topoisomerase IV subunit B